MGPLKIVVPNLVQVRNMVPKLGSGKVTYKISKMGALKIVVPNLVPIRNMVPELSSGKLHTKFQKWAL